VETERQEGEASSLCCGRSRTTARPGDNSGSIRRPRADVLDGSPRRDRTLARSPSTTYYEDLGISAFTGVERPDFEKLLQDCRVGKINLLIVYCISRLSRLEPEGARS
jgi:hypothetical protein